MLDNVNNDALLNNASVSSQQKVVQLGGNKVSQLYSTKPELIDQTEISDEAIKKYELELEIRKYKSMVLNMLSDEDSSGSKVDDIQKMIQDNNYKVDESTLANTLAGDDDLLNILF